MVSLGLDASTTCVGYAFTEDKKILDMGFIDIKKEKTTRDKVEKVIEFLNQSKYIDDVMDINVEDNLSGFAGGRTSQQTIIKLAKFNAILCFTLENFEFEVHNINPMTARKQVFGVARVKGIKAKDLVKRKIEKMYTTSKWCKTTTRGNWDKRNIDMYDGLVMSLYKNKKA
jgi:Holliday junction resolvasome RuvABC endonuclease subunit|tara:strand:+ start:21231 stop:21743 length:513 start_codon:yes stop_codon:yes gene_type:complete